MLPFFSISTLCPSISDFSHLYSLLSLISLISLSTLSTLSSLSSLPSLKANTYLRPDGCLFCAFYQ
jgi:hypothetical protein